MYTEAIELRLSGLTYAEVSKRVNNYSPYILRPSKAMRTAVLKRAGFKCENCGDNEKRLSIHHRKATRISPNRYNRPYFEACQPGLDWDQDSAVVRLDLETMTFQVVDPATLAATAAQF